jgi:hypothetical protein
MGNGEWGNHLQLGERKVLPVLLPVFVRPINPNRVHQRILAAMVSGRVSWRGNGEGTRGNGERTRGIEAG